MPNRLDLTGTELDWFAIDCEGYLARISSAGWGPVPNFVLEHFEAQQAIEQEISGLAGLTLKMGLTRETSALSDRGIFSYDWIDTYGPYQRLELPASPAKLEDLALPPHLQPSLVLLPTVSFTRDQELAIDLLPPFEDISWTRRGRS